MRDAVSSIDTAAARRRPWSQRLRRIGSGSGSGMGAPQAIGRGPRHALLAAFAALLVFFAIASPGFLRMSNIESVLLNNVAPLAVVAMSMTVVASLGAIDLSVGVAVDMASMVLVLLMSHQTPLALAVVAALAAAAAVGLFNGLLIAIVGIEPFLATLGTLFIGQTIQQLATGGGQPVYLLNIALPATYAFIGHGDIAGLAFPIWIVILVAVALWWLLTQTVYGRGVSALGVQADVARYSGIPVRSIRLSAFVLSAAVCGLVGLIVSSNVNAYVPQSGNAYLLNAIGATFVGATLSPRRRPSIAGTLVGVLVLSFVANGLLLIGWNFYWQQVATGVLIFTVLALGSWHRSSV